MNWILYADHQVDPIGRSLTRQGPGLLEDFLDAGQPEVAGVRANAYRLLDRRVPGRGRSGPVWVLLGLTTLLSVVATVAKAYRLAEIGHNRPVISSTKQSSEGPLRPKTCQRAQSHNSAYADLRPLT